MDEVAYGGLWASPGRRKDALKKTAPWFVQRFTITGGYFAPRNNTSVRADGSNLTAGTKINLENDLGFTRSTQAIFGNLQWRISRRSRLDLEGLLVNRSVVHTLRKDISFGDSTYAANTTLKAFFNAGTWRLSYGFALLAKPGYEIGLRIGAHVLVNDIGVKAYTGNAGYSRGHDFNLTSPLPDAGLWAGFELTRHFALHFEADYLDASISNTSDGRIFSYNAALSWRIAPPLQIAFGYKGLHFDINRQNTRLNGNFKWNTYGPQITTTLAFPTKAWKTSMDETFAIGASSHRKKDLVKKKAPWFVQRFTITGGYFAPQNNTTVQADGSSGAAGSRIHFENDLGFTKTTQGVFGNLQWRISRRSRLDLEGLLVNR
ncbi:MAG TPA: hypothetical protein VFL47_13790, partial [Flavisolibacter sp.]|nr:hypothetical protein [Flavisolibacter sp.]